MNETTIKQENQPRPTVEIHLPAGRVLSGSRGTRLEVFFKALPEWRHPQIVGAVVNGQLRELTFPIRMDASVTPLDITTPDGARIYRRSLTFLLEAAFEDLFPDAVLSVDHSVSSGGFFCEVINRSPMTDDELSHLQNHMNSLVKQDIPFERQEVPLDEAIDYFTTKGELEKVRLIKYRRKKHLILYNLQNHRDYHHGYMVPSTGYLKMFDLQNVGVGFVLRFTRRHKPDELLPLPDSKQLFEAFIQYGNWLNRLGISSVGALNDSIAEKNIQQIILVSEALQEQKIAEIARNIVNRREESHIVLIAGPSSSGKTTFSKRLTIQLLAHGISPFPLEVDNYFVDREKTPLDENGEYDFEVLAAIDTGLLSDHLKRLIEGQEVQLQHYNFKSGKSEPGDVVRLHKGQMIILEGIHGLNPRLLPGTPPGETIRLYVSCLTQLNLDRYNRISTTDTRLIRRIVRDARERGYSAQETIQRWESVRRGEKRHIFPYQDNADDMFNSALVYELSALKSHVEPLLRQVPFGTPEYIESKRLLAFLEWFLPIDEELIPDNSILREFIGKSILSDFELWETR
ncbi:MAG: nucleoside kinase [Anaerolineae bacterium]|nr:nucleoside kinase [Anaerolineae bacterium]